MKPRIVPSTIGLSQILEQLVGAGHNIILAYPVSYVHLYLQHKYRNSVYNFFRSLYKGAS